MLLPTSAEQADLYNLSTQFVYRLTTCAELCMGVFCTVVPSNTKGWEIDTLHTAHTVETGRDDAAVSVLLAHIVATRTHDEVVTDDSMSYPHGDNTAKSNGDADPRIGHQEFGRTVCIHSLAVHPKLQGVGIGKLIVKAYMQQVKNSALADRVALICQEVIKERFPLPSLFLSQGSVLPSSPSTYNNPPKNIFLRAATNNGLPRIVSDQLLQAVWLLSHGTQQGNIWWWRLARHGKTDKYLVVVFSLSLSLSLQLPYSILLTSLPSQVFDLGTP